MSGKIHSLETFGTVDGPGTRYVVFLQGCPMRCLYCHNPDTWATNGGQTIEVAEIIENFERGRAFYKEGGITVTGGEPLLQIDFVIKLFIEAKKHNIHTCIDTSGIVYNPENEAIMQKFDTLFQYTDLVMLDIKHIDPEEHKKLTAQPNDNILKFAQYLSDKGISTWIRHVVVPTITDNDEYLFKLGYFIGSLKTVSVLDVLPYHTMGKAKYENLGIPYPLDGIDAMDKEIAAQKREVILKGIKQRRPVLCLVSIDQLPVEFAFPITSLPEVMDGNRRIDGFGEHVAFLV